MRDASRRPSRLTGSDMRSLLAAVAMSTLATLASAQAVSTDYAAAPAGSYTLDPAHTSVILKVSHLGLSSYTLRLDGVKGGFSYDPAHPEQSKLQIDMDPTSVDAGDPATNRRIASDILEADRFPILRFVSTAVKPGSEDRGQVVGDLTLHGQSHPVTLDVIFNGFGQDPADHVLRMGFSADATVRRSDFGASNGIPMIGDEVSIAIETEFRK
jgi:polyisoprenoid-binding protein YceI